MTRIRTALVSPDPIDTAALLASVSRPEAGAVALFVGVVRDNDHQAEGRVVALDYTAHPSAPQRIGEIVEAALESADPDEETVVAAVHRIGHLVVGDAAFVVAVSSGHRRLAFEVCEQIVERVKAELPIWKQQFTEDGTYGWPGL